MSEKTEAQKRAQRKYMERFKEMRVRVSPERLEEIKNYAGTLGMSVSTFVNLSIDEKIARDFGKEND